MTLKYEILLTQESNIHHHHIRFLKHGINHRKDGSAFSCYTSYNKKGYSVLSVNGKNFANNKC